MRLAASDTPVAVKRRAKELVKKCKKLSVLLHHVLSTSDFSYGIVMQYYSLYCMQQPNLP
jgi:hypothetical protein